MADATIRRLDPADIERVRPLWEGLLAHHGQVAPQMPPVREPADSWRRRRALYEEWLAADGSFALVAESGGEPVGYALVRVAEGDDTWTTGDRVAELESLAVAPGWRDRGVGAALMDAVDAELERLGIADFLVGVVASNADAVRFYERRGLRPYLTMLYRRR